MKIIPYKTFMLEEVLTLIKETIIKLTKKITLMSKYAVGLQLIQKNLKRTFMSLLLLQ